MLAKFAVHGFKSLDDVSVDLGMLNVFVGANGSGKSNLLEAIGLLGAAVYGRVSDTELLARGVRPGVPALYKTSFHKANLPVHIYLQGTSSVGASYSVTLLNPISKPEPEWTYKSEKLELPGQPAIGRSFATREARDPKRSFIALKRVEFRADDARANLLNLLESYAIFDPDTPTLRGLEPDRTTRPPVGLYGGRLAEALLELARTRQGHRLQTSIKDMVDWVESFGPTASTALPLSPNVPRPKLAVRFTDKYMATGRDQFSGYEASEGVLYLLFGSILALHPSSPKILAIDNFDHALNPRVAKAYTLQLCQWLDASNDRQMLLTSHNPLVLDGLPLLDDRVRLFTVDRSPIGNTVVRRVEVTKKIMEQAENGMPLSEQWVTGNFGGLPSNV